MESLKIYDIDAREMPKQRAVHGPTLLADVWDMPEGNTIAVKFNNRGQPIDEKGRVLASFLGILARDALTLNFSDWRTFPEEEKGKLLAFGKVKW